MDCDRCDAAAVMHAAYSGAHLCATHLRASVERRVRRRVRQDGLLGPDATPDEPETWVVGLSGGKDSVVLTAILAETFAEDPRVELVALSVHEGIAGYRDRSLEAAEELVEALDADVRHETTSYAEEFDVEMDRVVEEDPEGMAPCAYCGVFRRDVLARHAERLGADKLLTGHNLDDEAQTALMNLFEGDVAQMAKHYDASLGRFPEPDEEVGPGLAPGADPADRPRRLADDFVPRAKPLRDVPEREVALYAHVRDLPAHVAECPHASEAYRGEVRDLLLAVEADHPGTRHSVMAGYEELAAMAAAAYRAGEGPERTPCERCGAPTTRDRCRKCDLVAAVGGTG